MRLSTGGRLSEPRSSMWRRSTATLRRLTAAAACRCALIAGWPPEWSRLPPAAVSPHLTAASPCFLLTNAALLEQT